MAATVTPLHAGDREKEKPLPNNIAAEQALIGSIFLDNSCFAAVSHLISAEDFYDPLHRSVYEIIEHLIGENLLANPVTMSAYAGELSVEGMTVPQYLARLAMEAGRPVDAADYAKVIKDRSMLRAIYIFNEKTNKNILEKAEAASKYLDAGENFFAETRPTGSRAEQYAPFSVAVDRASANASAAYNRGAVISGLSTGLDGFDRVLGGLNRGDLIILGGRPAMGKTALAVNMAYNIARDLAERRLDKQKTGVVGFASLEMPADQLAARIIAEHSKVSSWRVRSGKVSEDEVQRYLDSAESLRNLPIHIDQTGALPIASLLSRARSLKKRVGLEALFIDYLQLITGNRRGGREINRVQELTEITGALKALAKELDIPVVALSQLGRQVDQREDKRPVLSDLRESGSIEQDADSVTFCYREEYYLKDQEPPPGTDRHNEWKLRMEAAHGHASLIVAKNRHGPTETLKVGYNAAIMQFNNDPPESVANAPRERGAKPEKPKALSLPGDATKAYHELQLLLTLNKYVENESHVGDIPKGTKLVDYQAWKAKCVKAILEPSQQGDEKEEVKLMRDVCRALFKVKMIGRAGTEAQNWVWSTEQK